jgi:hypothetical protein
MRNKWKREEWEEIVKRLEETFCCRMEDNLEELC